MRSSHLSFAQAFGIASTMRVTIMTVMAAAVLACSPAPLTTDDLYGAEPASKPDAAAPPDAKLAQPDTATPDVRPLDTDPPPRLGVLSGTVSDRCTGEPISALVGIAGKHTCSFQGKGGFFLEGLPTDIMLTLASAAPGYRTFSKVIMIEAGGTPFNIKLERVDEASNSSCDAPKPPTPVCVCDLPTCVH